MKNIPVKIILASLLFLSFSPLKAQTIYELYYCEKPVLYIRDKVLPANTAMYISFILNKENKGLIISQREDDESTLYYNITSYLGETDRKGKLFELKPLDDENTESNKPSHLNTAEFYYNEQGKFHLIICIENLIFVHNDLIEIEE